MTTPSDGMANQPEIRITAMTTDFRAMLRVVSAFGLGDLTVDELLDQVERLAVELEQERSAPATSAGD